MQATSRKVMLESLLRDRRLDLTLTATDAPTVPSDRLAPTGHAELDTALGGGWRRGHLSEITGPVSSGRTTLMMAALGAAARRGEAVALVDTSDTFDPASAAACGVDLARLLWVREAGDPGRAVKALSLILQAGGFGLVVFDLADVAPAALRRFPYTTWMRLARIIEASDTAAILVGADRLARSAGGATVVLSASPMTWRGTSDRARILQPQPPLVRVAGVR